MMILVFFNKGDCMPRRADINKDKGRHSRKHGRRERIERETGIAPIKPKNKLKNVMKNKKK
jgi:hypothetical protein